MKRLFSIVVTLFLLTALLAACSEHLAPVGSNKNPGKPGVIILHDDPDPEKDTEEPPKDDPNETPEENPDTSGQENNEDPPDEPDPPAVHTHKYGSWIKKIPSTCTTAGVRGHYHCSGCGKDFDSNKNEILDLTIPPAGHTEGEWITDQAASCIERGNRHLVCSVCGETILTEEIPATGHTEAVDAAVAPTCTETGLTEGKHCAVCGAVIAEQEVIPATGHTETIDAAVAPTCTESGLAEGKHCAVCGAVIAEQEVIPATGHTEAVDAAVAPTCTESGLTEGKHCAICGAVIAEQEVIPSTGHTEAVDTAVAPTCTESGLTEGKHCAVCGAVIAEQEVIPATGHTEGEWIVEEKASCKETGRKRLVCAICGETIGAKSIPKTDHSYGEWIPETPETPATPTEPGQSAHFHCGVCGKDFGADKNELFDLVIPPKGGIMALFSVIRFENFFTIGCKHVRTRMLLVDNDDSPWLHAF